MCVAQVLQGSYALINVSRFSCKIAGSLACDCPTTSQIQNSESTPLYGHWTITFEEHVPEVHFSALPIHFFASSEARSAKEKIATGSHVSE